ncbi:MAG: tetratricopeptide repeat protein [Tepidisphaeraceae bacterium]
MTIRPKTKRRVLILLGGLVVFTAAVAWLYAYRMRIAESKLRLDEQAGMEAYRAGDYQTAIDKLAEYIDHEQQGDHGQLDPKALLAFANARAKVPTKNDDYIVQAISSLRAYCSLVPENTQERDHLLEMEAPSPGYEPDALARANDLLRSNPDDLVALKAIAQIYVRERKYQEAAPAADRYAQLAPTDLEMQKLNFEIMQALSRPASQMHHRADALRAKYPADPRFLIIKAWAYYFGQSPSQTAQKRSDDAQAYKDLILQAAKQDPPNSQFAKTTIGLLDGLGQFGAAQNLLTRASTKFSDPLLTQQLILRLWENRNYREIAARLKDLDPSAATTDPQLIAMKALALYGLSDNKSADVLVSQLSARGPDDPLAVGWSTALKAQFSSPPEDAKTRLAHYRDAQAALPDNGYIAFLLGAAYAEMDENELALQEWRQSCREMPSWDEPHVRVALLLVSLGHGASDEASLAAEDATLAGTNANGSVDLRAAVANVKVSFARLSAAPDPTAAAALLDEVKQIQTQLPYEPGTLPVYVALLSQTGQRAAAIDVIKGACNNPGPDGEDTLMSLVQLTKTAKLGMEDTLYAAIDRKYGATPRLVYARAMELLSNGGAADGLRLLQDDRDKNKVPGDAAFWERAICQYREASHDPGAAAAWQKLGDAYPSDIGIQTAILTTGESAWSNRTFIQSTIDRLKSLTGDQAILWKTAYARWLLSGESAEREASEAVVLLSGVTTSNPEEYLPHVLLATAYARLKNFSAALDEWHKAADLEPQSPQAQFNLLQALHNAGKREETRVEFDKLARISNLPPDMALVAATLIAADGDMQRAESLLLAYPDAANQVMHDATLAKVYRLENRPNEAAAIYFNLVHAKQLDVNTIREAADFFGAAGQLPEAHKFLDRLSEIPLPPGQRQLILASFEEERGTLQAAGKLYEDAIQAAADDPICCIRQIEFLMRQRNWSMAQSRLATAMTRWPSDETLPHLQSAIAAFGHYPRADELGSLIDAISRDPHNAAAGDTIPVATDPASPITQIQALLEKYPDFQPLYELTTRRLVASGHAVEAAAVANKAMGRFPQSIDAARACAEVNAAAGNWNDAIIAAHQWRQRVTEDTQPPDIFIAKADLLVDQAQDAIDRLSPYLANAKTHADDNQSLLTIYAQALIRAGRESEAAALLQPLARNSAKWRLAWLEIAPDAYSDGVMSGRWIDQIRPSLDPKSIDEHAGLAQAYLSCADRQSFPSDYALAAQALQPFLQSGRMTAPHWLTYASAMTATGDTLSAERAYRQALKVDPNNGVALNNLADLLRQSGDPASLKEAESLVSQAIASHPQDPNLVSFYATQAQILLKEGRSVDAIASFQKGYALNPKDLNILIGLASTYANSHQIDAAVRYLSQINNLVLPGTHLSGDLQAELDSLRQAIRKNASPNSVTGTDFSPSAR